MQLSDWPWAKSIPSSSPSTYICPHRYGYGFGALERSYYDAKSHIFYGGSEIGYLTVSDFSGFPDDVKHADFVLPFEDGITDVKGCGDFLFVVTKDDPNPATVSIFTTATRNGNGNLIEPTLIQAVEVGYGADNILINKNCTIAATADEGEGDYADETGLINPPGSVTILRGPFDGGDIQVSTVALDKWTDEELIEMGVHLPLSLNALKYWNASTPDIDFSNAIDSYTTASVLEPEYLAFSADESKLYVNLQENSALVVVDVATNEAESIHA